MSRHTDLVHMLVKSGKASMEWLLCVEDKVWERLEDLDPKCYESKLTELEDKLYCLSEGEAREIVRKMRPYGEYWSIDQIEDFLDSRGDENIVEYYLCMNMARNDYYNVASSYGLQDDPEFYYKIARDFIRDEDGKPYKVARYFM